MKVSQELPPPCFQLERPASAPPTDPPQGCHRVARAPLTFSKAARRMWAWPVTSTTTGRESTGPGGRCLEGGKATPPHTHMGLPSQMQSRQDPHRLARRSPFPTESDGQAALRGHLQHSPGPPRGEGDEAGGLCRISGPRSMANGRLCVSSLSVPKAVSSRQTERDLGISLPLRGHSPWGPPKPPLRPCKGSWDERPSTERPGAGKALSEDRASPQQASSPSSTTSPVSSLLSLASPGSPSAAWRVRPSCTNPLWSEQGALEPRGTQRRTGPLLHLPRSGAFWDRIKTPPPEPPPHLPSPSSTTA